ncbi:MAG: endonuclease/exonuclease/phosphatase family protein [Haliea sp.]|jgi:endonuclease/exonuclease/phosphatase (EEP) superfamily protein YafD|nr:endonuclease/exonuclease/phosphatase family protein [Haliea sp.]MDP5064887.1 endonuclease/exonuclease/phosphatase family protein [Haliea sp.]
MITNAHSHTTLRRLARFVAAAVLCHSAASMAQPEGMQDCLAGLGRQHQQATTPLGPDIQIVSWNIQKASNAGWAEDLQLFATGAELTFLQEASVAAAIPRAMPETGFLAFAPGYRNASDVTGVLTLSRHAASLECEFSAVEPLLQTPKATSVTEYPLLDRDERLLAINIHSVNFSFGLQRYREQLQALSNVIDRHSGPVLIAGDLNTWNSNRIDALRDFMAAHDLTAVTFMPDLRTTIFGNALDHVLVRGLNAASAVVIPVETSDHNPLLVSLRLP